MTSVKVFPGAANPSHDLRLSDDAQEFGLTFSGGPSVLQMIPISKSSEPFEIEQKTFTGGSGHIRYGDDPSGYFNADRAWTMSENRLMSGFASGFGLGGRNQDFNYTTDLGVDFIPLYNTTAYFAVSFVASASYSATAIELIVRQRGVPSDATIQLRTNNAGAPSSTVLQSATLTANANGDLPSRWRRVTITTQALVLGTTYWVVFKSNWATQFSEDNTWEVGTGASGTSVVSSNGIAWSASSDGVMFVRVLDNASYADSRRRYRPWFFDFYGAKYVVYKAALYVNGDRGTASAGSSTTLTDTKSWVTNRWSGAWVKIIDGTGDGQYRFILSNTGTVLTVDPAWDVNPDATSDYVIYSTPYWTPVTNTLTGVSGQPVVMNKVCYFPQGAAANVMAMRMSGSTHQFRADAAAQANYVMSYSDSTGSLVLVLAVANSSNIKTAPAVAYGTDLTLTARGAVGGTETKITNIFSYNGAPYIAKEEGLYSFTNYIPVFLSSGMKDNLDRNNGYAAGIKDNVLYVSWGHSISQLVGSTFVDILNWRNGFDGIKDSQRGEISQIIAAIGWLFFSVDGGTSNYSTVFAWNGTGLHEIYRTQDVGVRIKNITWQVNEGTNPRLWISEDSDFKYVDFPFEAANPLKDSSLPYHWESIFTTSTQEGPDATFKKLLHSLRMVARSLKDISTGFRGSIEVDYQADDNVDSDTWYNVSRFFSSPLDEVVLDIGSVQRWRFRIRMLTNYPYTPVVIEKVTTTGWSVAPVKYQYIGQFVTATGQTTYTGAPDHKPDDLIDFIMTKAQRMDKIKLRSMNKQMDGKIVTIMAPTIVKDWVQGNDWGGRFSCVLREV